MASNLPSLTMPAGTPGWLLPGYALQDSPVYAHVGMTTGHSRTRRIYTAVEREVQASIEMTSEQLAAWHAWHENELMGGVAPFSTRLPYPGGPRWFEALLKGHKTKPRSNGKTVLTATLLLRGQPSLTGPSA